MSYLSERTLALEYIWTTVLHAVARNDMPAARRCERYYSAIEEMTDGAFIAACSENVIEARL